MSENESGAPAIEAEEERRRPVTRTRRTVGEPSMAREPLNQSRPTKVAIVGVGMVGSTYAYTLLLSGIASEIVLIDANHERAEGEAMDLNHAVPFAHPTKICAGTYADCEGAAITVIAAGVGPAARRDAPGAGQAQRRDLRPDRARRSRPPTRKGSSSSPPTRSTC